MKASHSTSGEVEVAYSAGRRNGTSAPYQRAISAISSESVETTTRAKTPLWQRGLDRVRKQRVAGERADVLPRNALRPRAGRDEGDRGLAPSEPDGFGDELVSTGHGDAEALARANDRARDRVELGRPPASDVPRGRGREAVVHLDDPRPLGGGHQVHAVRRRDAQASATACSMRGRHSSRFAARRRCVCVSAVVGASDGEPDGLPPEHALLVVLELDLDARAAGRVRGALELARGRSSEAIVTMADGVVWTICMRPAR